MRRITFAGSDRKGLSDTGLVHALVAVNEEKWIRGGAVGHETCGETAS